MHKVGVLWVYGGVVLGVAHPICLGEESLVTVVDSLLEHVSI